MLALAASTTSLHTLYAFFSAARSNEFYVALLIPSASSNCKNTAGWSYIAAYAVAVYPSMSVLFKSFGC